jgi:hypothetical protein
MVISYKNVENIDMIHRLAFLNLREEGYISRFKIKSEFTCLTIPYLYSRESSTASTPDLPYKKSFQVHVINTIGPIALPEYIDDQPNKINTDDRLQRTKFYNRQNF